MPKNFQDAPFLVYFSQLPALEKDTENGAPGKNFGPFYFDTALTFDWQHPLHVTGTIFPRICNENLE